MRRFPCMIIMAALLLGGAAPICSAKGKPKPKPKPVVIEQTPDVAHPAAALSPYIVHLEALLALNRPPDKALQPLFAEASGRLVTLRQQFVATGAEAPAESKGQFSAGVATCDELRAALEDRQKALGDLEASRQVQSGGRLNEAARKDNLTQGIKGDGLAKAVGSVVERDREKAAAAKAQAQTAASDRSLAAMAENNWRKRSVAWQQRVVAAYQQIK